MLCAAVWLVSNAGTVLVAPTWRACGLSAVAVLTVHDTATVLAAAGVECALATLSAAAVLPAVTRGAVGLAVHVATHELLVHTVLACRALSAAVSFAAVSAALLHSTVRHVRPGHEANVEAQHGISRVELSVGRIHDMCERRAAAGRVSECGLCAGYEEVCARCKDSSEPCAVTRWRLGLIAAHEIVALQHNTQLRLR